MLIFWLTYFGEFFFFLNLYSTQGMVVLAGGNPVACCTWSDWDLNLCLENECKRYRHTQWCRAAPPPFKAAPPAASDSGSTTLYSEILPVFRIRMDPSFFAYPDPGFKSPDPDPSMDKLIGS